MWIELTDPEAALARTLFAEARDGDNGALAQAVLDKLDDVTTTEASLRNLLEPFRVRYPDPLGLGFLDGVLAYLLDGFKGWQEMIARHGYMPSAKYGGVDMDGFDWRKRLAATIPTLMRTAYWIQERHPQITDFAMMGAVTAEDYWTEWGDGGIGRMAKWTVDSPGLIRLGRTCLLAFDGTPTPGTLIEEKIEVVPTREDAEKLKAEWEREGKKAKRPPSLIDIRKVPTGVRVRAAWLHD